MRQKRGSGGDDSCGGGFGGEVVGVWFRKLREVNTHREETVNRRKLGQNILLKRKKQYLRLRDRQL